MNKSKSYYKDPNRRSNWFKAESVPVRKLNTARKQRYQEWQDAGHTDYHALVKALEIVPKKKMLEDFSRSIFWQHREKFCEPIADEQLSRQVIDAYLIFCLGRYMTINSYCEIGVWRGATLSLIMDTNPGCKCLVVDPKPQLDFLGTKIDISKVKVNKQKLQEYGMPHRNFDFILIDGDHDAPMPKLDVIKMLNHCHQDTMIWLDDVFLESGIDAKKELSKAGWRLWIKGSSGELWAKERNLQPFINLILSDESFKKFCVVYRERSKADQEILVINMPGGFLNKIDWINKIITDELKSR